MLTSIALSLILSQNLQVTFKPAQPITFAFEHNGDDGSAGKPGFRLWCDGAIIKNYAVTEAEAGKNPTKSADGTFTYTLIYPGFPTLGVRNCSISAFNSIAQLDSDKSNVIPFIIGTAPSTPVRFKFVITIGG